MRPSRPTRASPRSSATMLDPSLTTSVSISASAYGSDVGVEVELDPGDADVVAGLEALGPARVHAVLGELAAVGEPRRSVAGLGGRLDRGLGDEAQQLQ